ncbi:phosphatidate cytidylyltransferase, partial [bacterium]|nr:phosphatidate cytidylyltransferase [bacterium]
HNSALADSALSLMGVLYCGIMPATLVNLRYIDPYSVIFVVLICVVTDVGAYFVGKGLGKSKLAPHVSPGKTWAGFWGAVFFTVILGGLWGYFRGTYNLLLWSFVALGGSLVAQAGDLFESSLKRDAQVKDSGNCIPGHGGVLDRFDSYLFVSVYVFIFTLILNFRS